jgi:hypothetical protein
MADQLSAIAIATFAFLNHLAQTDGGKKFVESIVGELGKKTLDAGLGKAGELKRKIVGRLSGNPKAEAAIAAAETGDQKALNTIAAHLQLEMDEDETFAAEIKQIAQQIINISKIEGRNVQNNYGGQNLQVNDPKSEVIQNTGNNIAINNNHYNTD